MFIKNIENGSGGGKILTKISQSTKNNSNHINKYIEKFDKQLTMDSCKSEKQ